MEGGRRERRWVDEIIMLSVKIFHAEPSVITTPPSSRVLSTNATVSFLCVAEGSMHPEITWTHNNQQIITGERSYVTMNTTIRNTGRRVTTSNLTLLALDVFDTGVIECQANSHSDRLSGNVLLEGDEASADLTVLGRSHYNMCESSVLLKGKLRERG